MTRPLSYILWSCVLELSQMFKTQRSHHFLMGIFIWSPVASTKGRLSDVTVSVTSEGNFAFNSLLQSRPSLSSRATSLHPHAICLSPHNTLQTYLVLLRDCGSAKAFSLIKCG